jgi:hypothetical protein
MRERIGLELGSFSIWWQNVAGEVADTLQAQQLIPIIVRVGFE